MNWEYFNKDFTLDTLWSVLIGTVIIYIVIILYTRIFGLKSFSKMTGFDFINTVAIGNLLAMSIGTGSPKLLLGIVIIGILYFLNYLISLIQFKSKTAQKALDNSPVLLMIGEKILEENMKKCRITKDELRGKLREANVIRLSQVKAVILETTGDVSVLHSDKDIEIEDFLLESVQK